MAPLNQYLMPDESSEVALARSAAPKSISDEAEVLVFGRDGYKTAVKGRNGFVCLVLRSWTAGSDCNPLPIALQLLSGSVIEEIRRQLESTDEIEPGHYQAALAGADAVLLIVAALNDEELTHLMRAADNCGIDALVEVHDELEPKRALSAGASFIGINNRNLATFQVDLRTTEKLARLIPTDRLVISESGIRSVEDIRRVAGAGVHGALIGESLMRAQNPQALLESFRAAAEQSACR
jgi:hypothetical protein